MSRDDWMETDSQYVYHSTQSDNVESIQKKTV